MNILVLDHFFSHDLEALKIAAPKEMSIRSLPFQELRGEAMRIFPPEVADGLQAYIQPEFAEHRKRFAQKLEELLFEEYRRKEFDAFVVPSDTFFYVRAAPAICQKLGVSFFCIQKETTISPSTMEIHAKKIEKYAPCIADHMVVCSERHKDFWVNAGTEPKKIDVTGQPRFDFYCQPECWPKRTITQPTVLFFSYMLDAYHPSDGSQLPIWLDLHLATEEALWELAHDGWKVLIKPHPQQPIYEMKKRIFSYVGKRLKKQIIFFPGSVDSRRLIVNADVLVGFQSTVLIEAMVLNKPIIYTGWDQTAKAISDQLIPFHQWGGAIDVVDDPSRLASAIRQSRTTKLTRAQVDLRRKIVQDELGLIDGFSSQRALEILARHINITATSRSLSVQKEREALSSQRAKFTVKNGLKRVLMSSRWT